MGAGDVKKLVDDLAALRPTIFIGVPRVFDRIYVAVTDQIKKGGTLVVHEIRVLEGFL